MTNGSLQRRDRALEQHWDRFIAWCTAWDLTALPAEPGTVTEFLRHFPASVSTQRLRRQAIRRAHAAANLPDPAPEPAQQRVWRDDPHSSVEDVLAALPKFRFPIGLRGRRDAFLIVLLGVLGQTRAQAGKLTVAAIDLGDAVRVDGRTVPRSEDAARCAACAVTRWLRIVGLSWVGRRGEVTQLLDPTRGTLTDHDCAAPMPGEWQRAEQLLLPLDVHGWARSGVALSGRSMTAIVPRRRAMAAAGLPPEAVGPVRRAPSRFDGLTLQEAYDELGATEDAATAALAHLQAVLDEAGYLSDLLDGTGLGVQGYPAPSDDSTS